MRNYLSTVRSRRPRFSLAFLGVAVTVHRKPNSCAPNRARVSDKTVVPVRGRSMVRKCDRKCHQRGSEAPIGHNIVQQPTKWCCPRRSTCGGPTTSSPCAAPTIPLIRPQGAEAAGGGLPSYSDLLTCLQIAEDARKFNNPDYLSISK
jgi:hypothetical protein